MEHLGREILRRLPDASVEQDGPATPGGAYVVDVTFGGCHVVVQFLPSKGYGISASSDPGFGQGPDETLADVQTVVNRVIYLLRSGEETTPPRLRELRRYRGVTQIELAKQLGIQQASVSKIERREDLSLASLRRFIRALGGELEITARFPDGDFSVLGEESKNPA